MKGFVLCGQDHQFFRATARVEGDKVIVFSEKAPNPVAVRYAWERSPECNLYNKEHLPT